MSSSSQVHSLQSKSSSTLSKPLVEQTSNNAASNLGRDEQLSAITSLNRCAKATLISLIMNNGGGNREHVYANSPTQQSPSCLKAKTVVDPPKTINILVLHSRFYFSFVFFVMRLSSHLFLSWSVNPSVPNVSQTRAKRVQRESK